MLLFVCGDYGGGEDGGFGADTHGSGGGKCGGGSKCGGGGKCGGGECCLRGGSSDCCASVLLMYLLRMRVFGFL